jgi:glycosyltransferase involved in cell wall biosynthesis
VAELASRFKAVHDVHVYANTFEEPEPERITFHRVPMWRPNVLCGVLSFAASGTLAIRERFDVVHAQGLCGLRHNVATAHIVQAAWHASRRRCGQKTTLRDLLWRRIVSPLERLALTHRGVRRVIAVSERVRNDLRQHYARQAGVEVVNHGVDLETFHPRHKTAYRSTVRGELGVSDDACLALYVGDLQKGALPAIHVAARFPNVCLAFLSSSNNDREREEAIRIGAGDRVRFAPFSPQISRYFAAADVFLFPTVYDSFGLVIAEAMAAGLPVVTSRTAGAAELIEHGRTGLLTDDPWDVPALAEALGVLVASPERRAAMGAAARAAIEPYTWDRTAEQTLEVYRQVVAERAAGR